MVENMTVKRALFLGILTAACTPRSAPPLTIASPGDPPRHEDPQEPSPSRVGVDETADARGEAPDPEGECNPYIAPLERRAGNLLVNAPPATPSRDFLGRLRTHVEGSLTVQQGRVWVGPQVPGWLPLVEGTAELFLLEQDGDVFVGVYRDPYDASSCTLSGALNCDTFVKAFDRCGEPLWSHRLNDFMSRTTHLELQDLRVVDGSLYFNEACQSYAKEAKGKCSALVAVDPVAGEVSWRTSNLVSNNRFIVHGDYIIAGYGFTAEPDHLNVIRRRDGKVVQRVKVPSAHQDLRIVANDELEVVLYPGVRRRYALRGWDGPSPKLELVQEERPPR